MSVRFFLRINTEFGISNTQLTSTLNRLDFLVRSASIGAIGDIGFENKLPQITIDAAIWRALNNPDGLLWVEAIEPGSINIKAILITAAISMALNSTIGESIKEGWKQTSLHHSISESIPKIEEYFIRHLREWSSPDRPFDPYSFDRQPIAITRDENDWMVALEVRPHRRARP
jgi:hypothetical protein